jgi:hypothetical protein
LLSAGLLIGEAIDFTVLPNRCHAPFTEAT